MNAWGDGVANPGSQEAVAAGCTCAVFDNCHGAGFYYAGGLKCFYITGGCPLHAAPENDKGDRECP